MPNTKPYPICAMGKICNVIQLSVEYISKINNKSFLKKMLSAGKVLPEKSLSRMTELHLIKSSLFVVCIKTEKEIKECDLDNGF